jgi:3-hydroxyisobutyrate dehydrogenase-like beta-hydroxyacid dehydrogenase
VSAQIALLHPGEMGSAIGAALVALGHQVSWRPDGRSERTQARAEAAGLIELADLRDCDLVISICPPAAALDTARSVAGYTGRYLDANAISPDRAREVATVVTAGGARYVDGGVIGPPPRRAGTTRLYLSGDGASEVAALFAGAVIEPRVLDTDDFAASTLKMAYAGWTKISTALLLAARETADELGVHQALAAEWAISQPELVHRVGVATASAEANGWRWEDEMRQIADTFAGAGQPAEFARAAAQIFGRFPRPDLDEAIGDAASGDPGERTAEPGG